jgi:hypothetical protein
MESQKKITVCYANSLYDFAEFLNRNPDATHIRIEMGPRFWGNPSITETGIPDSYLHDARNDVVDAIVDHPSLEILVLRGPSKATYSDLASLLTGAVKHPTFRSLMLPVIPPEWYQDSTEKCFQLRNITRLIRKRTSLINIRITNGGKDESKMTTVFQKMINSILHANRYYTDKKPRESLI